LAFIVLLAGTGLRARIIPAPVAPDRDGHGLKGESLDRQQGFQKRLLDVVKTETDPKVVRGEDQADPRRGQEGTHRGREEGSRRRRALADAQIKRLNNPWFHFLPVVRPRPTLAKVQLPGACAQRRNRPPGPAKGEPLRDHKKALSAGGNHDVTVMELAGLNHLFQTCKTGAPSEYATIEESFASVALAGPVRLGPHAVEGE